ncbi:hypothetical protein V5F77_24720 [Xanthobacter sp. DSM 24535]|uniref:hypothetical protein n=1 Tax=Roseixanthobacter psychrophilus TaxID=3119917 RepID=UPI003726D6D3
MQPIEKVGRALYGEQWQAPLSRDLSVRKDTIGDFRQGRGEPGPGLYHDMLDLAEKRMRELQEAIADLRRILGVR